ncbi:Cytochrome b/b6 domain protein [Planctopirus limnophila DSM 3776]|uniref:Cytochrome b/b6 domain protein n=1 Tax=Planctopirus limnophila (strain ATCC 43296 / DSM 3776 / IFAM 1008 / Mu 290) TaxID=521674 RepID=D5SPP4_PLAL2|nr:cytochrome b N-terminal domain-containing protein [Planctopirus limnophila]ADG66274.1 Cytochrome b/b6 domain protein [Planctopirus limnophila DSM 3776]
MHRVSHWLEARTGLITWFRELANAPVAGGPRWRYAWGSVLVVLFITQLVTGLAMAGTYSPGRLSSWESTYYIQHQLHWGWLVRGIHHYAAQAMVVALALQVLQIVWDRWYLAPRELSFWATIAGGLCILGLSHTGYQLPGDQRAHAATSIFLNIMSSAPVAGPYLQELVQGSSRYGNLTLSRLYVLHVGLLPLAYLGVLCLQTLLWRAEARRNRQDDVPLNATRFWPGQALRNGIFSLLAVVAVVGLTLIQPAELGAPMNPAEAFSAARPEWYFLFLFRFLKFEFVQQLGGLVFGAIYLPTLIGLVILIMPWTGRSRWGHKANVAFLLLLLAGVGYLTVTTLREDALNVDHQLALHHSEQLAQRTVDLASQTGIPASGAVALLANDPLTQGPRLFQKNCAACHHHEAVAASHAAHPPQFSAADLSHFGSREWMKAILIDYATVLAPLKNHSDATVAARFLEGDMASWSSDNRDLLLAPENATSLAALLEFMAQQSGRKDRGTIDEKLALQGREVFATGKLASGSLSSACIDCHAMHVRGEDKPLAENSGTGAPTLTGYGGSQWLTQFLKAPGSDDYFGAKNAMPAFDKLPPRELEMLVQWMTGDYWLPAR